MRKILIPTDFSENAMNALKYALELFKYDKSEFFILHAYQDEIHQDQSLLQKEGLEKVTELVQMKSQQQLETVLDAIYQISPNPRHKYKLVSANNILVDETDKIVIEESIDIIVMGTRGHTNDKALAFGSNTLKILKYVDAPVLAIPEKYSYKDPKQIVFPTNYMIPYRRRELKLLCELASNQCAAITMLYVSQSGKLSKRQEDNKTFLKTELCKNELVFETHNDTNIDNAIYTYIKENNVDMLVMVNNRRSFLEAMLVRSTIQKMSLHIDIPFLALQNVPRD
ncbi:universal stress protein family protein [Kordia sp. SMS9]|uniref:universal stress protein n=1 Tax=Kordia sp. SMS9 TaxID=2282170 RepID=UPI000E0D2564|nr:universal stress protein [Kordia sp. SMS9]AXG70755.1 universal stress protein family protein [Kordia sp. SMS9]